MKEFKDTSLRSHILLAVSCACLATVAGCPLLIPREEQASTTWIRTYGGEYKDLVHDVCTLAKGGYVIAGQVGTGAADSDAWIFAVDELGERSWSHALGRRGLNLSAIRVASTSDGGAIVVGNSGRSDSPKFGVAKFDALGRQQWRHEHTIPKPNSVYRDDEFRYRSHVVVQLTGGRYLVASVAFVPIVNVTSSGTEQDDPFEDGHEAYVVLTFLTSDGEFAQRQYIGGDLFTNPQARTIPLRLIPTLDNKAVLAGSFDYLDGDNRAGPDTWVWQISSGGGVLWERKLGFYSVEALTAVDTDNDKVRDNGFAVVGTDSGFLDTEFPNIEVTRLGPDGEVEWSDNYDSAPGTDIATDYGAGVTPLGGRGVFVTGNCFDGDRDPNSYVHVRLFLGGDGTSLSDAIIDPAPPLNTPDHVGAVGVDEDGDGANDAVYLVRTIPGATETELLRIEAQPEGNGDLALRAAGQPLRFRTPSEEFNVRGAEPSGDGGILVYGYDWFVKFDAQLNEVFRYSESDTNEAATGVIQSDDNGDGTPDGDLFVAGYTSTDDYGRDMWLLRLTTAGTLRFQRSFGGVGDDQANDICQTVDGNYVIVGSTRSLNVDEAGGGPQPDGDRDLDACVLKVDANGNVIWQRVIGGDLDDEALTVSAAPDGGVLVGGLYSIPGTGKFDQEVGWLIRMEGDGNVRWQRIAGSQYNHVLSTESGFLATTKFAAHGYKEITSDGEQIVDHHLQEPDSDTDGYPEAVVLVGESADRIVVGELDEDKSTSPDVLVSRFGQDGSVQWSRAFSGAATDLGMAVSATSVGGALVGGTTSSVTGSTDIWLLKVAPNGNVSSACPSGLGRTIDWEAATSELESSGAPIPAADIPANAGGWQASDTNLSVRETPEIVDTRQCFGNDADEDGINDFNDDCPDTPFGEAVDPDGCSCSQRSCDAEEGRPVPNDADDDGIVDQADICPEIPNPTQSDLDGDRVGDECDNCPIDRNSDQLDTDGDGLGDECDNCPFFRNELQTDQNQDGVGDVCEDDADGDGIPDDVDNCPILYNYLQDDEDGDGAGDRCDTCPDTFDPFQIDSDDDGVGNACDDCPFDPDKSAPGECGCGTPDADSDEDGTLDCYDLCPEDPGKTNPGVCGCGRPEGSCSGGGGSPPPPGPVCGNGAVEAGETCDDGNTENGDGCSANCTIESDCGDGIIDEGEACDDMGESAACDDDCTAVVCGDGTLNVTAGEECDDGNNVDDDGCDSECFSEYVPPVCGNEILEEFEECDDGNTNNGDGCDATCFLEICGNFIVQQGEECDTGFETAACDDDCTLVQCGDENINETVGEQCDDGNVTNGDGCDEFCIIEACGNQFVQDGEDCDDGAETATCDADCTFAECGDGTLNATAGEQCDDGNMADGDGCSATCMTESGAMFTLGVMFAGGGSGSVFISPVEVNCSDACNVEMAAGTVAFVSPQGITSETFGGWTGCDEPDIGIKGCFVTMNQDRVVTLTINP